MAKPPTPAPSSGLPRGDTPRDADRSRTAGINPPPIAHAPLRQSFEELDEHSERELVRRARAARGGPSTESGPAWAELVRLSQDRLYAVCYRMVGNADAAADLTQEAFVRIIQGLDAYDGRSRLLTWMTRIAMNGCLSFLRSQRLRRHASLDSIGNGLKPGETQTRSDHVASSRTFRTDGSVREEGELRPHQSVQRDERHAVLRSALAGLPVEQRAILILRDVQGLDYDQVAEVLGLAAGTVKSRLFRARLALRDAMERSEKPRESGGAGTSRSL